MVKQSLRQRAITLRKKGFSYNLILEKIPVSKSTLSVWLRDIPYKPNKQVQQRVNDGLLKSAQKKQAQKARQIKAQHAAARKDVRFISKRDLFMLGIGLYWGEGEKSFENIRFANSDPEIIKVMMKWFRDICTVPDSHFRITVHAYSDTDISKAIAFWSSITKISKGQFLKSQIDKRSGKVIKRGKSPHGTLHIRVRSCGDKQFGVLLHRRIVGWIRAVR